MRKRQRAFYLNPINYLRKILRITGLGGYAALSKYDIINKELKEIGVIKETLSPALINAIIDYGVPLVGGEFMLKETMMKDFTTSKFLLNTISTK